MSSAKCVDGVKIEDGLKGSRKEFQLSEGF